MDIFDAAPSNVRVFIMAPTSFKFCRHVVTKFAFS